MAPRFEYRVVPAPAKGKKAKGVKTPQARFALGVEAVLNEMAADGWEYLRAELLPSEERSGLTGTVTRWRNVLVFRRPMVVPVVTPVDASAPPAVEEPPQTGGAEPPSLPSGAVSAEGTGDAAPENGNPEGKPDIPGPRGDG